MKNSWQTKKLGEVCDIITRGISPKYIESNGICVLNQKCIRDHRINYELSRLHDNKAKNVNKEKIIQLGDVLVNSTGTGTLGRVAQVRETPIVATVDSHITIVRPIKELFYNDFFGYALIFIEDEIAKKGEGCGGQTELARSTLKNDFIIKFPTSLQDQQRIASELDFLLAGIKKLNTIYQHNLTNLAELQKSVLQNTFNGESSKIPSLIEAQT